MMLRLLTLVAVVAYPFVVHISVLQGYVAPPAIYLSILLFSFALVNIVHKHLIMAVTALIIFGTIVTLIIMRKESWVIYSVPVVIQLSLAYAFGHTLFHGRVALVTQIATKMRGQDLDARTIAYTRAVTWIWTVLFIGIAIECVLLSNFATHKTWSLFANLLNYVIIIAMFVVEYIVRVKYLYHLKHDNFRQFMLRLFGNNY